MKLDCNNWQLFMHYLIRTRHAKIVPKLTPNSHPGTPTVATGNGNYRCMRSSPAARNVNTRMRTAGVRSAGRMVLVPTAAVLPYN